MFDQSGCIRANYGCIRTNVVVFGQSGCTWSKFVVIRQ